MKKRFIDRDVLSFFAHHKLLYESREHHNAVFVGIDENGVARHAHKRGTYSDSSYKGNVDSSNPRFSFHHSKSSFREVKNIDCSETKNTFIGKLNIKQRIRETGKRLITASYHTGDSLFYLD
jgi:hypothetical protein